MTLALTSDKQHYLNPSYASTVANSVLKIATGSTLTTNLDNFFAVDSSASNQVWGGEQRADIRSPYTTSSADALEWQRCIIDGITPAESTSPDHVTLVMDELYPSWVSNGIGYYGDTSGSPLFLESEFGMQIFDSSGVKKVDITSALVAVAGVDSVTISANSSIQVNIAELNNSGVWKVFLDGFPYSGSNPIYTSVINPSVAYFNGYYTLTNNSTVYSWAGTAFVYRVS